MTNGSIAAFLADDHTMVRDGLAALIDREPDINVIGQCGNGLDLLEHFAQVHPDVLVLDITMPGLNGLDICREIVRRYRETAVLILTMHDDEQFIARALEYGASGYLLKEAAGTQLAQAVRAVANGQLYLGPGIPRGVLQRIGRGARDPYETLTTREREVLQLIAEGKTNRQIAEDLGVAVKTIDTHRSHLMRKLAIHDQTSLVKYAIRRGITDVS
jgi:DNA-binding NarL/FixJ family response regulator